ncbi:MAG: amino acid adenylation domain-containing protein [Candidatus Aminicenantes bacterium]|jgi:amino acid adenylation domain-containing protein
MAEQEKNTRGFRLSPQQKHLWRLQQVDHHFVYCARCTVFIEGPLNITVFKAAVKEVLAGQKILRTTFCCFPGMTIPLQVINHHHPLPVHQLRVDLHDTPGDRTEIERLFFEKNRLTFNFEKGPLLQISLSNLSPATYLLLFNVSSLYTDKAGLKNLVREICQYYAAKLSGRQPPAETMQYVDFCEWQNDLLEQEEAETAREYWKHMGSPLLDTLKLPFENTPAQQQLFTPQLLSFSIDPGLLKKIEPLTQNYDTSYAVLFLACWHVLLWRLLGKPDIIVGTSFHGRSFKEFEKMPGLFEKYLPIRCHLEKHCPFHQVVYRIAELNRDGYELQEYFSWDYFEARRKDTDTSIPLFFPYCFDFNEEFEKYFAGEVSFSIQRLSAYIDRFKIKVSVFHQAASLSVTFFYDSNRFHPEDINRLAENFKILLQSAVNRPETPIGELAILSHSERQQFLEELNRTKRDYQTDLCINHLFEEQVTRTPGRIAVAFAGQQISYAELNGRANRLARYLRKQGVGPGVLTAIHVERSLEMLTGLLGILKADGAYVPLEPIQPPNRFARLLKDINLPVLLTQKHLVKNLPAFDMKVICLDSDWQAVAQESNSNLMNKAAIEDLCYVLFTSGSTGNPKGVMVEHRQLLNYFYGVMERLDFRPGAHYAVVSTLAADLGNTVIFPSLCTGGCLHVISQQCSLDPGLFADYVNRHLIDHLKIVPSHLEALLEASEPGKILPRQQLILGGEASKSDLIEKIKKLNPGCLIFNHYGPTETTVGVLSHRLEPGRGEYPFAALPLGRPLANTEVYLLDSCLQPVPLWVPGQIYIGGLNLARGYLNDPDTTAARFIVNPLGNGPGSRLYKSGDLARCLPGGSLEFIGRTDNQLKWRGYRIELGEIESVLNRHPSVKEVVVIPHREKNNENRLVAYLVPPKGADVSKEKLRRCLLDRLPEYMIPADFVIIKKMPLTPNGKIDRNALDDAELLYKQDTAPVLPRTKMEQAIANIWQDVLRVEKVSIHDNFFDLGGHSLLMIKVHNQLQIMLKKNLSIIDLFRNPTIGALAKYLGQDKSEPVSFSSIQDKVEKQKEAMIRRKQSIIGKTQ